MLTTSHHQMNNITTTTQADDIINFLEDVDACVRDLLHTIQIHGDSYTSSVKFQSDLEHLKGVVAQGV